MFLVKCGEKRFYIIGFMKKNIIRKIELDMLVLY